MATTSSGARPEHRIAAALWLGVWLAALVAGLGLTAQAQPERPPGDAAEPGTDTRPLVVLLHSYDPLYDWSRDVSGGVYAGLQDRGLAVDVREEYLDTRRQRPARHLPLMRELLRVKYGAAAPVAVVTSDDAAVEFLLEHPDVFAGVPVVFGGIADESLIHRLPRSRFTGLGEDFRLTALVEIALQLRPATRRLFAITPDSPAGRDYRYHLGVLREQRRDLEIVDLSAADLEVREIVERIRTSATARDLVLMAPIARDASGREQKARDVVALVTAASRAPVIGFAFSELGQGVLATTASTGREHGRRMAEKLALVLRGVPPSDLPIEMDSQTVLAFDAQQLGRWGIPREALPAQALLRNEEPSFYRAYRRMIWAGAVFMALQMLAIGALVVNVRRRRRAEAVLAAQASALVASNRELEAMNLTLVQEQQGRATAEEHLRHAQKMEAVGRLAGGVAHDFNNLLTVILGYASLLLGQIREPAAAREGLEQIRRAGEQAASLTQNLLAFSRKSPATPMRIDVGATVRQLEPMVRRFCGDGVQLALDVDPQSCHVSLGEGQLEQVLLNLVINARDAMPEGGHLRITCGAETIEDGAAPSSSRAAGTYAVIRVTDTGVGMDDETRAHVFEPFFTTKPVGRGTGLGLATVYGIVTQHGGTIAVSSTRGEGSCFTVWLPAATGEVRAAGAAEPDTTAATGQVVLVVEDETDLRRLAVVVLRGAGFEVIEAASGPEALQLVEQRTERLDVVLTDIVMPGMDGYTLARRLRELRRHLPVAFMSGYVEPTAQAHAPGDPSLLLRKPFTPAGLLAHVRQVLARPEATPVA